LRIVEAQTRCEKTMAAGRAMERRDKQERGHMFTWRLRAGTKDALLLTLRAGTLTTHLYTAVLAAMAKPHDGNE
jgi:hypothetical protein